MGLLDRHGGGVAFNDCLYLIAVAQPIRSVITLDCSGILARFNRRFCTLNECRAVSAFSMDSPLFFRSYFSFGAEKSGVLYEAA